jgi:hypothetical protein
MVLETPVFSIMYEHYLRNITPEMRILGKIRSEAGASGRQFEEKAATKI